MKAVFEEVEDDDDFWFCTGWGGCGVDDDARVGFKVDLVEAAERLIAAMAALVLADTSCPLVFVPEVVLVVTCFDWTCTVVLLQV